MIRTKNDGKRCASVEIIYIYRERWGTFVVVWMDVRKGGQRVAEWVAKMAGRKVVLGFAYRNNGCQRKCTLGGRRSQQGQFNVLFKRTYQKAVG